MPCWDANGWCPACYSNVKGRGNWKGHKGFRPVRTRTCEGLMSVLRKRDEATAKSPAEARPEDDDLIVAYPCLWEHMAVQRYPDGSPRVLSTVTLFVDGGLVKACLNDRDQGLTAWASGNGLRAVLRALEAGLANDNLDWRQPQGKGKGKR